MGLLLQGLLDSKTVSGSPEFNTSIIWLKLSPTCNSKFTFSGLTVISGVPNETVNEMVSPELEIL